MESQSVRTLLRRTCWSQFRDATNVENRAHNIFNEITALNGDTTAVTHDPAGNMVRFPLPLGEGQGEGVLCTWDGWNRLTRLSDTSDVTIATYTYDGDWKRLKKTVGTNSTEYYYDDMQLAETRQIGATGQVTQTESLVYDTRYLHSVACRDIYSGTSPTSLVTRHFFINDGNFNVTALVSTNGSILERYGYDPYGKVTIRDAAWQPITWDASEKNIVLYTGHKYDAESGLYYSIYRYYHSWLGRWARRDPLLEVRDGLALRGVSGKMLLERHLNGYGKWTNSGYVRETGEFNLFGVVRNNPLILFDSIGLDASSAAVVADIKTIKKVFESTTTDSVIHYVSGPVSRMFAAYGGINTIHYGALPTGAVGLYTTNPSELTVLPGYTGGTFAQALTTLHELTHAYDDITLNIPFTPVDNTEGHAHVSGDLATAGYAFAVIEKHLKSMTCDQKFLYKRWQMAWKNANYLNNSKFLTPTSSPVPITATDHDTYVSQYGLTVSCRNIANALNSLVPNGCCVRFNCAANVTYGDPVGTIPCGQNLPATLQ